MCTQACTDILLHDKNCGFHQSFNVLIAKVKHLLSLVETGVLHHLACCTHKQSEAGCDSKSKQAGE